MTTTHRARAVVAGLVAAGLLLVGGCAGALSPGGPDAEVADAADCAVRETLEAFGGNAPDDLPSAPRAGAVPDGFAPVAAVECRSGIADEPLAPGAGTPVDVVRLEGDLAPLLEQLRRPDVPPKRDQACIALFEVVPVLYLVDADGRAVRVQWPTGECGFLLGGARESVDALEVTQSTVILL